MQLALHFKLCYLHFNLVILRLCPDLIFQTDSVVWSFACHVRDPALWIVTQCFLQCQSAVGVVEALKNR